ncbi:type II toxin-antitoxin system RelE/ParE family toxin [Mesorhizobium sophorae]|uniref:type II toxin-antitoxin system RelE/ParE family toxin n=1 Tax=Mesorhizobium sophorae TaxID=1300294 RepID=UPI000BA47CEF|nr:type II toxin-antitoxin system RelE/ParE family toxin [Mesorhizobium sophorae]
MKRIDAKFYATEAGKEPVRDWLLELGKDDRKIVGGDIAKVEFGWPIGMPTSRDLGRGLLEVRSTIRDGKVEARTYFSIEGSLMLLLHGHEGKGGQKEAMDLARDRLRDYRRRLEEAKRKKKRETEI